MVLVTYLSCSFHQPYPHPQILVFQATIDNGFVTIRGRIKDVIITSGGKKIAPNIVN